MHASHVGDKRVTLRHVADKRTDLFRSTSYIVSEDARRTRCRYMKSEECMNERRFSRAVRAEQADAATTQRSLDLVQAAPLATSDAQPIELNYPLILFLHPSSLLLRRRLRCRYRLFLRLHEVKVPIDSPDLNLGTAGADTGFISAKFIGLLYLEIRQVGLDLAVHSPGIDHRIDWTDEADLGIAVHSTQIDSISQSGDRHIYISIDPTELGFPGCLRNFDISVYSVDFDLALEFTDAQFAVQSMCFELDPARKLEHDALVTFRTLPKGRPDTPPLILHGDPEMFGLMSDDDVVELQIFFCLGRTNDEDFGCVGIRRFDIDLAVDIRDGNFHSRQKFVRATNLFVFGKVDVLPPFIDNRRRRASGCHGIARSNLLFGISLHLCTVPASPATAGD